MEVILAKTAGFCFGVKRAVDTAYKAVGPENVFTFGPIIHNEEVVEDLREKGANVINSVEELPDEIARKSTVIIRSHGVAKSVIDDLHAKGATVIDATCPFVKKIHNIVAKDSSEGKQIIIVGSADHPEVEGIVGWCESTPHIVKSVEEIQELLAKSFATEEQKNAPVTVVSQTTFNNNKFKDIVDIVQNKLYNAFICDTICDATAKRQSEARQIASTVDAMVVIGGRNSSNTQKLYEISKKECENTYYIQTLVDLDLTTFESVSRVGITAGASTPNFIIKEVHSSMAEQTFEELLNNDESKVSIRPGEIIDGTIISVKPDSIIVDIRYKSDGVIPRGEYTNTPNADLTELVKEGDPITAKVVKTNDGEGQVLLSYKRIAAEKVNEKLEAAFESGETLTGKVVKVVAGGLSVAFEESTVFIPASLVSDVYEKDLSKYMDTELEFVITEYAPKKRRVIGNRRQLVAAAKAEAAAALFASINVGDVVEGTVKNVTDFGAFVDLGGADGLLHISEMSWGRIENPKKVFKTGDPIKAFIKDINGEKIALSLKFDETNPWVDAEEKYAVGTIVSGRVARMTDFGAFIELEPGVDALLHVSQISRQRINKPDDVLKKNDTVEAKITAFDLESKKISLSMKELLPEEEPVAEEPAEEVEVAEPVAEPVAEEAPAEEPAEE